MPATSRHFFLRDVEKPFPRVSQRCVWKPWIFKEARGNTLDILGVLSWLFHRISWELRFPLGCPDVLRDAQVPSSSFQIDYIMTLLSSEFHYILTEGATMSYSNNVVLA